MATPRTVSGNGSGQPLEGVSMVTASSWDDVESDGEVRGADLLTVGLRLARLERGLSMVEAEEPDTSDGVLVWSKRATRDDG